jgi:nucleotide-binding universal stress UspA family protein
MRILACIDASPTAQRVLETACAIRPVFGGTVEGFHVREPSGRVPTELAARLDVALRVVEGRATEETEETEATGAIAAIAAITNAIGARDVVAGVLGARGEPAGARPCGHVAMAVVAAVDKPIVVVPPRADGPGRPWERVLVPLDGHPASSLAVAGTLALLHAARIEVVVLHVFDDQTIPSFWDQPHHSMAAWVDELTRRHGRTTPAPTVELRTGSPADQALGVASGYDVDAIVLGWSRSFDEGRALTVCRTLGESRVPVVLLPVGDVARGAGAPGGRHRTDET